jgi:hypothetical protein
MPSQVETCPTCKASIEDSLECVLKGSLVIRQCCHCNTHWAHIVGEGGPEEDAFEDGLVFGECALEFADHLECEGFEVRGVIGEMALRSLHKTSKADTTLIIPGGARRTLSSRLHCAGVPLDLDPELSNSLILIGTRPKSTKDLDRLVEQALS